MEHFAWPIAALIFGVVSLFLFRTNIAGRIDKVLKIERNGVTIGQEPTQSVPESMGTGFQEMMDLANSPLLLEREAQLREALKARGITGDSEAAKVLTRALASSHLSLQWEQIERMIYGSQLSILVEMNARPNGLSVEDIKSVFDAAAKQFPDTYKNYGFSDYVNFLTEMGLVAKGGVGYQITLTGKEFMIWLVKSGRTHRRHN